MGEELAKEIADLMDMTPPVEDTTAEVVEESTDVVEAPGEEPGEQLELPGVETPAEEPAAEEPAAEEQSAEQSAAEEQSAEQTDPMAELAAQNEALLRTIMELQAGLAMPQAPAQEEQPPASKPQEQPAAQPPAPAKFKITDQQFTDAMTDPDKLIELFEAWAAHREAQRPAPQPAITPEGVAAMVQQHVRSQAIALDFYRRHETLRPFGPLVKQNVLRIVTADPNINELEALEKAAEATYAQLGRRKPTPEIKEAVEKRPAFASKGKGRTAPVAPKPSSQQAQMLDLVTD